MKRLKYYTFTVLLSTFLFPQVSRGTTVAPPLETDTKQLAEWFSGYFNNSQQVAINPEIPFIKTAVRPQLYCEVSWGYKAGQKLN